MIVAKYRHLDRAPIHEAIIEIRFNSPGPTKDLDTVKSFHSLIKDKYPAIEEKYQFGGVFEFGMEKKVTAQTVDGKVTAFRFSSADNRQIVIASLTSFSFSRLKPYETWEKMSAEAFTLWKKYKEIINPETITRVSTRFINRLEIPSPIKDFSDYFTCLPTMPKKLPQLWSNFFTKIQMHDKKLGAVAIFQHRLEPQQQKDKITFFLDVDVIKDGNFPNDDQIRGVLNQLRKLKNDIFFECITEKTARLFQ